jgi:type IX secretion system PorP/SprF family membrane protein
MKKIFTFILLVFGTLSSMAQDPHFSQFFASPLTLNPAFTGKFNGNYRVAGNHRNQWPSINNAFITSTASVDFHILKEKLNNNDLFGVGFMFLNDNSANSAVKFNYAGVSAAFHKGLDEDGNNQLGIGFQAVYSNMLINTTSLKFEDQLTNLGFTGTTSEVFNNATLQSNYFDLNAGILFNGSSNETNNYYAGVSMYHINSPKQKFTGTEYIVNPRFTFQAGYYFTFNDNVGLHLSGMHSRQAGTTETLIGGAVQFITNPEASAPVSVYAGSWMRLKDAIIPYIGLEFSNARLGISYDVNTSSLKTATISRGGLEISLIYSHQPNTDKPIKCPKF